MNLNRCQSVAFWMTIVGLLCVAIPIHIYKPDSSTVSTEEEKHSSKFQHYIQTYNKTYNTTNGEYQHRYQIFKVNPHLLLRAEYKGGGL